MSESLQKQIQNGMVAALKSGDRRRKDVLSYLLSELQATAKAKHVEELTDAEAITALQKQMKKVRETLEATKNGSRPEVAEQATSEIAIIEEFLPAAPSVAEVETVAQAVIADLGATSMRDMGRVIAEVSNRLTGVDKTALSGTVKRLLTPA